jgi:hypothetical protein
LAAGEGEFDRLEGAAGEHFAEGLDGHGGIIS